MITSKSNPKIKNIIKLEKASERREQNSVKMIDQGSSELNIIIGVEEEDFEAATRAIYDMFVLTAQG